MGKVFHCVRKGVTLEKKEVVTLSVLSYPKYVGYQRPQSSISGTVLGNLEFHRHHELVISVWRAHVYIKFAIFK